MIRRILRVPFFKKPAFISLNKFSSNSYVLESIESELEKNIQDP